MLPYRTLRQFWFCEGISKLYVHCRISHTDLFRSEVDQELHLQRYESRQMRLSIRWPWLTLVSCSRAVATCYHIQLLSRLFTWLCNINSRVNFVKYEQTCPSVAVGLIYWESFNRRQTWNKRVFGLLNVLPIRTSKPVNNVYLGAI